MAGNDGFARSVVKSLLTRRRPERETDAAAAAAVTVTSVAAATSVGDGKGLQSGIGEERERGEFRTDGRRRGSV